MQRTVFTLVAIVFSGLLGWPVQAEPSIRTIAGSGRSPVSPIGKPLETSIGNPFGVEVGPDGKLYICEVDHHRVFCLNLATKKLSVVAGTGIKGYEGDGGPAVDARLNEPYEIRFAPNHDLYFVEMKNHIVRKVDAKSGLISTVAGNGRKGFSGDGGAATAAELNNPHSIAVNERSLYIADIGNHRIRRVDLISGKIESIAGNAKHQLPSDGARARGESVLGPRALFLQGNTLWVALREGHSIWTIDLERDTWKHIAGTGAKGYSGDGGDAKHATFNGPKGIAVGPKGNVFVVDTENQAIRVINVSRNQVSTLAGSGPQARGFRGDGGTANRAWLARPHGICVDDCGRVYIGDSENHRVRLIEGQ